MNKRKIATKRELGARKTNPLIYAFVEGRNTERQIVKMVNEGIPESRKLSVSIRKISSDPEKLHTSAVQLLNEEEDAHAWIICDVDDDNEKLKKLVPPQREKAHLHWALSNPCVDAWLVFHYESITAHIDRKNLSDRAKKLKVVDSKKGKEIIKTNLTNRLKTAMSNAATARHHHKRNGKGITEDNPSSDIDLFIRFVVSEYNKVKSDEVAELIPEELY